MDPAADYVSYWSDACRSSGGTVEEGPVVRLHGPPGNLPIYGVVRFDDSPDEAMVEAQAWQAKGAPFSFATQDAAVAEALAGAGLVTKNEFVFMRLPVTDMGAPRHEVEWVDDAGISLPVQAAAHDIPTEVLGGARDAMNAIMMAGRMHVAVVRDAGVPVGCASLYTGNGNAGLYGVSVLSSHRRQGIGRSITQARMRRAIDLGLTHAVATTTPDGFSLAQALGGQETGRLTQMVWFP